MDKVIIRGIEYEVLKDKTGHTILKTFDKIAKMWVTLKFTEGNDESVVEGLGRTFGRIVANKGIS